MTDIQLVGNLRLDKLDTVALVIIDMNNDFCHPSGHFAKMGCQMGIVERCIPNLAAVLAAARKVGVLIIHIQNTTLPNGRSDSEAFRRFKNRIPGGSSEYTVKNTWGWEISDLFSPLANESVVEKHRPSGFVNTTLDQLLSSSNITTVIFGGIATEGCVQATAVDAMYRDYLTVVVEDGVGTYSDELHQAGLSYLGTRVDLLNTDELLELWKQ